MKQIRNSGRVCRVVDETVPEMFRDLNDAEIVKFREWADAQDAGTIINSIWHPIVQDRLFEGGKGVEQ